MRSSTTSTVRRSFAWLTRNWNSLTTVAALLLSLFNYFKLAAREHNIQLLVRPNILTMPSRAENTAPTALVLPDQIIVLNVGESAEVLLGVGLVVGIPQTSKPDLVCINHELRVDPVVLEAHGVYSYRMPNAYEELKELTTFDEDEQKDQLKHASKMLLGLRLVYLDKFRNISNAVINLGELKWDVAAKYVYGSSRRNFSIPLTVVGLAPEHFAAQLRNWLPSSLFPDTLNLVPCARNSFKTFADQ